MKYTTVMLVSLPISAIVQFVSEYFFTDWHFVSVIFFLVLIDTLVSVVKHFVHKDASSEDFWKGIAKKFFVYVMLIIVVSLLNSLHISGDKLGTTEWLGTYLCVAMVVREVVSIVENSNAISPWLPAGVLKRLKDFNENGEYIKK